MRDSGLLFAKQKCTCDWDGGWECGFGRVRLLWVVSKYNYNTILFNGNIIYIFSMSQ